RMASADESFEAPDLATGAFDARSASNGKVGPSPAASATNVNAMTALDVRIARFLGGSAGMGHGTVYCRSDLLAVFPQIAGREAFLARFPVLLSLGEFVSG